MKIILDTRTRTVTARGRLNPVRSKEFRDVNTACDYLDAWMRKYAPNVRSDAFISNARQRMEAAQSFTHEFRTPANHIAGISVYVNPYT